MEIKVPFLQNPTGLGDVIATATKAVGIKPCAPCEKRRRLLNSKVTLAPRWRLYPEVPDGWVTRGVHEMPEKIVGLYEKEGAWIVWEIFSGRYQNSYSFCCDSNPHAEAERRARAKLEGLWR